MECKWHQGEQARFTCVGCGRQFCRECVVETGGSHFCPDCHRAELDRFASRMGAAGTPRRARRGRKAAVERPVEEAGAGGPAMTASATPPAPGEPVTSEEAVGAAAVIGQPPPTRPEPATQVPPVVTDGGAPSEVLEPPAPPGPPDEEFSSVAERPAPVVPGAHEAGTPAVEGVAERDTSRVKAHREGGKREKRTRASRKQLRKPVEGITGHVTGAPSGASSGAMPADERAAFWGDIERTRRISRLLGLEPEAGSVDATAGTLLPSGEDIPEFRAEPEPRKVPPGEPEPVQEEGRPPVPVIENGGAAVGSVEAAAVPDTGPVAVEKAHRRGGRRAARRERRLEVPVAMQTPDDYAGEVREEPSYPKAVLWGLLVGLVLFSAYAAIEWQWHPEPWVLGITGWVIGAAVGFAVVLGSGRHFNWKLGLVAAGIAMFCLCFGQVLYSVLEINFGAMSGITKNMWGFSGDVKNALQNLGELFPSRWIFYFFVTGGVAFLLSFRPWPVRLELSGPGEPARRA